MVNNPQEHGRSTGRITIAPGTVEVYVVVTDNGVSVTSVLRTIYPSSSLTSAASSTDNPGGVAPLPPQTTSTTPTTGNTASTTSTNTSTSMSTPASTSTSSPTVNTVNHTHSSLVSPTNTVGNATLSSSPGPPRASSGYTAGSLAGGIVGAALGAAIITFLATFFICRRRNSRRVTPSASRYEESSARWTPLKGGVAVAEKPASQAADDVPGWLEHLPQSADDRMIRTAVKTLFDQIELHVDNYYARNDVVVDETVRADLDKLETNKLPAPLDEMMRSTQAVLPVIKHCIANLVTSSITPGNSSSTLLPSRLATLPPKLGQSSNSTREYNAAQQAYSHWKCLNAYLFPTSQQDSSDHQRLESIATKLSDSIHQAFKPWQRDQRNSRSLKEHQKSVIMQAAQVGQLVQSQPSAFTFDWSTSASGSRFDVLPGFLKTSDEQGRPLESPQVLVEAMTMRM